MADDGSRGGGGDGCDGDAPTAAAREFVYAAGIRKRDETTTLVLPSELYESFECIAITADADALSALKWSPFFGLGNWVFAKSKNS